MTEDPKFGSDHTDRTAEDLKRLEEVIGSSVDLSDESKFDGLKEYLKNNVMVPSSTNLTGWETSLTDPAKHRDTSFRYVIHAVEPETSIGSTVQSIFILQEMQRDPSIRWNKIDLLQTPEKIVEKAVISTSLIDSEHRVTWRAGGYILRVPLENILKTCREDCGTQFHLVEDIVKVLYQERDTNGIADPDTLLRYSSVSGSSLSYNEVVVTGTGRTGKQVEISGIFVKVFPNGDFVNEVLAGRLSTIAYQKSLPFLRIVEPYKPYQDENPDLFEGGFGVDKGGKRYVFHIERAAYFILEYGGKKTRTMCPRERAEALGLVRQYLSQTPDEKLQALVAEAEKVSDETLQQRVAAEMQWKERDGSWGLGRYQFKSIQPVFERWGGRDKILIK